MRGRLDDARRGVIVVVQQRIHEDDLSGYLLAHDAEEWIHLNLPAIAERDELIPIGPGKFYQRRVGDVLDPARESLSDARVAPIPVIPGGQVHAGKRT